MDAPEPISTEELVTLTRGMAYDTATLLEDVARRMQGGRVVYLRNVVAELKRCANEMATYADTSPDPPASG